MQRFLQQYFRGAATANRCKATDFYPSKSSRHRLNLRPICLFHFIGKE